MNRYLHIVFCFVLILGPLRSISQHVDLSELNGSMLIGDQISITSEQLDTLTIERISSQAFQKHFTKSEHRILNFLDPEAWQWLKVEITKPVGNDFILEIAQPLIKDIEFFKANKGGEFTRIESGYQVNVFQKLYKNHLHTFKLDANSDIYYIKLKAVGLSVPIRIWEKSAFEKKIIKQHFSEGILLGVLLFVILINLFLFLNTRKFSYLHYSFLVFMYTFFIALFEGYILYFFPSIDLQYWYYLNPIINQVNGLAFCIIFLEVNKYAPKVYKYVLAILIYFISYIFWYRFFDETTFLQISQAHALLGISTMAFLGILVGRRGNPLGYYFSLAYIIFFVIATIELIYMRTGKPKYILNISHISFGIFIEVCILALLLTKRFQWDKENADEERKKAQQLLLKQTLENERIVMEQNTILENRVSSRTQELNSSLANLKATQAKLIQTEKLASLGELTAGIAHEIQNPLNFVNNFSEVSIELIEELKEDNKKPTDERDLDLQDDILGDLESNLKKIGHHGNRASSIVKNMLEHSRTSTGKRETIDLNKLCDEYLRLSYHGLRAKDKAFNADFEAILDEQVPTIEVVSQDFGRVLLNIINNAFYAVKLRSKKNIEAYKPKVIVQTQYHPLADMVEICISDNGEGISAEDQAKIFQPFFTTKPPGEGTGLGLSLSHEIIKAHGGDIGLKTKVNEGTEFIISIPIK